MTCDVLCQVHLYTQPDEVEPEAMKQLVAIAESPLPVGLGSPPLDVVAIAERPLPVGSGSHTPLRTLT